MHKTEIKKTTPEDSPQILAFIQGLAEHIGQPDQVIASIESIRNTLFSEDSPAIAEIAYYENKPAGFVLYYKTYSTFSAQQGYHIEDLFVSPEYRGKGIGSALLNHVLGICKEHEGKKVEWHVDNANQTAIDFYASFKARKLDYKSIFYLET